MTGLWPAQGQLYIGERGKILCGFTSCTPPPTPCIYIVETIEYKGQKKEEEEEKNLPRIL